MSPISPADLTHDEALALVGLLKIMIEADKRYGLKEAAALQQVAERVGRKLFNRLVDEARECFPDREALKAHAAALERPEARVLIHSTLKEMAFADSQLKAAEEDLLGWLAQTWHLGA